MSCVRTGLVLGLWLVPLACAGNANGIVPKIHIAAEARDTTEVLRLLTEESVDVDLRAPGMFYSTPLHCAVRGDAPVALDLIRALVAAGANVNARSQTKSTALHYAAAGGHVEAARLLIRLGAKRDVRDSGLQTPYDTAVLYHPSNVELKRLLRCDE